MADTMGIVPLEQNNKTLVENIASIINGHIKPGMEFNSEDFKKEGKFYIENPTESDKVHCVVLLFNIKVFKTKQMEPATDVVKELLEKLYRLDIPRIVVLTHADELCDKIKGDISYIFYEKEVKEAVWNASEYLGVPVENIHPVVNYSNTDYSNLNHRLHIPILLALKEALYFTRDTLHKRGKMIKTGNYWDILTK